MTTSGLVTSHEIGPVFFSIGTMGSNYLWICIWNSGICNFMGYILISDLDLAVQRFTFLMLVILVFFCYWSLVLLCSWFVSRFLPDSALKWSWYLWISLSWTVLSLFISNKYRKEYPNKLCENATFIRLGFLLYIYNFQLKVRSKWFWQKWSLFSSFKIFHCKTGIYRVVESLSFKVKW